jgi:3D (Asp-Asp-Asp) domain-containing protein
MPKCSCYDSSSSDESSDDECNKCKQSECKRYKKVCKPCKKSCCRKCSSKKRKSKCSRKEEQVIKPETHLNNELITKDDGCGKNGSGSGGCIFITIR